MNILSQGATMCQLIAMVIYSIPGSNYRKENMTKRYNHNDLTAWFLEDHSTLPAAYVKSCEEFFEELARERGKLQATSEATSVKRCNLFTTMLDKKTESENKK